MQVVPLESNSTYKIWSRKKKRSKSSVESSGTQLLRKCDDGCLEEGLFVRTFPVDHYACCAEPNGTPEPTFGASLAPAPSSLPYNLGYTILSRHRSSELLPEHRGKSKEELSQLARQKVVLRSSELIEHVIVTYTGDTSREGLILPPTDLFLPFGTRPSNPSSPLCVAFRAQLVICELTYLDAGDEKTNKLAKDRKHVHIDDLEHIFASHGYNSSKNSHSKVVFFHTSAKYGPSHRVARILGEHAPNWLRYRTGVINNSWWTEDAHNSANESVIWLEKEREAKEENDAATAAVEKIRKELIELTANVKTAEGALKIAIEQVKLKEFQLNNAKKATEEDDGTNKKD